MRPVPTNSLTLPRANPGPEPWPEPANPLGWWFLALLGVVTLGLLARRLLRRRANAMASTGGRIVQSGSIPPIIMLVERVRDALSQQYGPEWNAKTTEELAEALYETTTLAPKHRLVIVCLLEEADRVKFSGEIDESAQREDLAPVVTEALAALVGDGARSTRIGK